MPLVVLEECPCATGRVGSVHVPLVVFVECPCATGRVGRVSMCHWPCWWSVHVPLVVLVKRLYVNMQVKCRPAIVFC